MTMTDPIADLLNRIRNAHLAKHDRLDLPGSRIKVEICRLLKEQGYIEDFQLVEGGESQKSSLRLILRYTSTGEPLIRHMRRVSKPGRRVYHGADEIQPVLNGLGVGIVSTSQGLLTDQEARKRRLGGEILCEIW